MSATNGMENGVLLLYFNNTDHANIGDAAGLQNSAAAGSFYLSLHTADPGEAGDQTTNETTYGSYARQAVARSSAGFTVSGNSCTLTATVAFPEATSGTATITHFGLGTASSAAGNLLFKGTVTPNLSIATGVTPRLTTGTAITAD